MRPGFHICTFGCQMNVNDSDWLRRALTLKGMEETPLERAAVVILNTCSVREKPEQRVYDALRRITAATRHNPHTFAVVAGCVAQQVGAGFFDNFPQVRLVTGTDGLAAAPDAILRLLEEPQVKICLTDFTDAYPERDPALAAGLACPPVAYVNIMQGCDNFCAYCIVPYTRGRQKSRQTSAILDECRALLAHGAQEITLLGQNVNAFGQDSHGDGTSFPALLRQVAALDGLRRLRFVTPHPKDLSDETIALFGECDKLCPRLHLPLQAGSDSVLNAMKRRYTRARYLELAGLLRAARPDMALSADIIVGFPGESEADFLQTLEVMEAAGLMSSFSFCYSPRPGSPAARMPGKVPPAVMRERLSRLQALQDRLGLDWLKRREGQHTEVLVEGPSRKHAPADAPPEAAPATTPESDAPGLAFWQGRDPWGVTVNVALPAGHEYTGALVPVRITRASRHTLQGQALPPFRPDTGGRP